MVNCISLIDLLLRKYIFFILIIKLFLFFNIFRSLLDKLGTFSQYSISLLVRNNFSEINYMYVATHNFLENFGFLFIFWHNFQFQNYIVFKLNHTHIKILVALDLVPFYYLTLHRNVCPVLRSKILLVFKL